MHSRQSNTLTVTHWLTGLRHAALLCPRWKKQKRMYRTTTQLTTHVTLCMSDTKMSTKLHRAATMISFLKKLQFANNFLKNSFFFKVREGERTKTSNVLSRKNRNPPKPWHLMTHQIPLTQSTRMRMRAHTHTHTYTQRKPLCRTTNWRLK